MSKLEANRFLELMAEDSTMEVCREEEAGSENVSGIKRSFHGRIAPADSGRIGDIVRCARRYGLPLYPVSCGRNWGYGSFLPVTNKSIILDLSRLKEIRNSAEISREFPVAVVEPGVTQGQLFSAIDERGLAFNATGAGPGTSIVGNSLERGFGYSGLRPHDVLGLEVVLGTGETFRSGFWGVEGASASLRYPSGLGPSMEDLFFQSNFGIVTAMALRLRPKPPCHAAMMVAIRDEADAVDFFDQLGRLRREGVFNSIMHIGNRHRAKTTLGPILFDVLEEPLDSAEKRKLVGELLDKLPYRRWSGVTSVEGSAVEVDDVFARVEARMSNLAVVERLDEESLRGLAADSPEEKAVSRAKSELLRLTRGEPVESPLWSPYWALGLEIPGGRVDMDDSDVGLLFCAPVFPLDGDALVQGVRMVEDTLEAHGFTPYMTLNMANELSVLGITNVVFDRRDEGETKRAHAAVDALYRRLMVAGHHPYRLGIQSMDLAGAAIGSSFGILTELKKVFDPDGVIAPGRYGLG